MEAAFFASSAGAARSGACVTQAEAAIAASLSGSRAGSCVGAGRQPKQIGNQQQLWSRAGRSKMKRTPKRVQALLADHDQALHLGISHVHVPATSGAVSGGPCTEQQLELALPQRTVCVAQWAVQAQGMSDVGADEQGMMSSMQVGGSFVGVPGAESGATALMAFELLSSTVSSSGACPPSAEVHVLATAMNAGVVAHQDQQQQCPDVTIVASAGLAEQLERQQVDRAINALMVGAAAIYATTKILTVDHDYWHGWTIFEILKYAPMHNWSAYEQALKSNPVLAKMMISGIVYSLGDWIAQCYEGKPMLDFKRERMIRSGLVGFCLHGSLSHYYYHVCEALFPFKEWWVVPLKVAFDQSIWSGFWNSVYFVVLGLLRLESPLTIASELKSTFFPLLTAGWKLWPFAHLITYGFVPVEQRLLWVDMVELVWVTILSMYSNEKAEARLVNEASSSSSEMSGDCMDADTR